MKKQVSIFLLTLLTATFFSCNNSGQGTKNNSSESEGGITSILSSERKVYEADRQGNKKGIVFIYKDDKLYEAKKDGSRNLIFIREGNNVYEVNRQGEKKGIVFVIENEHYAYEASRDGSKKGIVFIKEGDLIYEASRDGSKKGVVFILE